MTLFLVGLALILAGGVSVPALRSTAALADVAFQLLVGVGCALAAVTPVQVLASGVSVSTSVRAAMPGGPWMVGIDALSAVFILLALGVGGLCAFAGTHDAARERRDGGSGRWMWFTLPVFAVLLVAIVLVAAAQTVVVFLGAWEIMAIASYVLIVTHHEQAEVRRAGLVYLVATHAATLALFAMFASWQVPAADWSFAALAASSPSLGPRSTSAVLLLALVGFGFKAGCVPMHFWLPPAHASAPSHVSALMSGVVIKTGIYGVLRVLLLLGGAPAWFGWLVLGLGVASGVLGVLWALAQHDTKRLLAYHSVENIGIILMGVGVGVLGVAFEIPVVATLGFAGGLLHTVNHALFKSLLFLGAGAVYRATGTRNMEELGGLARRMPLTWLAFIVGAAAIIGVPPFNGFVSEWLVYQSLFRTGGQPGLIRLAVLGVPALALIGGLALACFAKVAGVVFLGSPRTDAASRASEASAGSLIPLGALAVACTILGVVPPLGLWVVDRAARGLVGTAGAAVPQSVTSAAWTISAAALATITLSALLYVARNRLVRGYGIRREPTWGCAYPAVTPRMQYTASSFASPLVSMFGRTSGMRVDRSPTSLRTHSIDLVLDGVALPAWHALHRGMLRLRAIQHGRLSFYLLYVMAALLLLLGYLSLGWRR